MISDIGIGIYNHISLYADDSRLYGKVKNESDVNLLQNDLETVYKWADNNNMEFNSKKFELLRFGKNDDLKAATEYKSPTGEVIEEKESLRDLGITMSNDLSFDEHIEKIVTKGIQLSGWVLRTFTTRKTDAMMLLFKQLIRSGLEYCCPLWSPNKEELIQKVENVQRTFTRKISGLSGINRPNYWERLQLLNIYSLQRRRERYIILYTVKALNGSVPNPGFTLQTNPRTGPRIKVPLMGLSSGIVTPKMKDRSLSVQGAKLFNILPRELRTEFDKLTPLTFKKRLDEFLKNVPDQPTIAGLSRIAESNSIIDQIACLHN